MFKTNDIFKAIEVVVDYAHKDEENEFELDWEGVRFSVQSMHALDKFMSGSTNILPMCACYESLSNKFDKIIVMDKGSMSMMSDDGIKFTFLHEIGHIVKDVKSDFYETDIAKLSQPEIIADSYAIEVLKLKDIQMIKDTITSLYEASLKGIEPMLQAIKAEIGEDQFKEVSDLLNERSSQELHFRVQAVKAA
jgi:hypothetical protein